MSVTDDNEIDVRALTRWLGVEGARAGLDACRSLTIEVLRHVAEKLGCSTPAKGATRAQVIEELVRFANRRIDKPVSELLKMQENELIAYFEKAAPSREELLELLREIKIAPSREGQKGLIRFAARELAETGRFIAIASAGQQLTIAEKVEPGEVARRSGDK